MPLRIDVIDKRDVRSILNALKRNLLVLRPPYQRNLVWLDRQKAALVDTILRAYPIPEIYMQDLDAGDGQIQWVVVDGQQRLRACLEFLEGGFALDPDQSPEWGDVTFDGLGIESQQAILDYEFVVRVLPMMPEEEVRNIFKRLNQNVLALNRQELRHATYWGPFIKTMEDLSNLEFWSVSGVFTPNDVRRMLDIEFISELAVALLNGHQNKKDTLDDWYEAYEQDFEERERVQQLFRDITGEIGHVLPALRQTRWSNKSDFYSLFLVLGNHDGDLPLTRDQREELSERLTEFGEAVSRFTSRRATEQERAAADEPVQVYGSAVQRAASDVGSRIVREAQLERFLDGVW